MNVALDNQLLLGLHSSTNPLEAKVEIQMGEHMKPTVGDNADVLLNE
jgi:hypothetical protein